jgi:adenylate cyclase
MLRLWRPALRLPVAVLVGLLGVLLASLRFTMEEQTGLSWLFRARGAVPPPAEVAILRFDRESFLELRALPEDRRAWPPVLAACAARMPGLDGLSSVSALDRLPRALYACAIDELTARGVAVIAVDIAFKSAADREAGTDLLAAAIARHGRVVLLERALRERREPGPAASAEAEADVIEMTHPALAAVAAGRASFVLPMETGWVHQFWTRHPGLVDPVQLPVRALEVAAMPAMERLALALGRPPPATGPPDARRAALVMGTLAAVRAAGGVPETARRAGVDLDAGELRLLAAVARGHDGRDHHYLNLYGPSGTLATLSAIDLLWAQPDVPQLAGRSVFVGAQELYVAQAPDSFRTVFPSERGVGMSGVEIAATAYANLLDDRTLVAPPEGLRLALVFLLGAGLVWAAGASPALRGLGLALGLATAYAAAAVAGFVLLDLWLPLMVPAAVLVIALLAGLLLHNRGLSRWLVAYVPGPIADRILEGDPDIVASRRLEVTVLLADIAGFSTLSERMEPEAVELFLDQHFDLLVPLVQAEGGMTLEFQGDGALACFGAPTPLPDHAARACRAALAIEAAMARRNRQRKAGGQPPVRLRIGLHSGPVAAGNVGGGGRTAYTITGDTVNTTQRIEQLGKVVCPDFPEVVILASAATVTATGGGFLFEAVGTHHLRGRERAEQIFRLRGALPRARAA